MADPSYHAVASERTGHAEVVRVEFDPAVIQLDTLLDVFFSTHDPTTLNRQGHDAGTQYRSAVFFTTDEQKAVVEKYIAALTADRVFDKPIVTEVKPLPAFYPAEEYHQDFYNRNTSSSYCQFVIEPKLAKLRARFTPFLKENAGK